MAHPEQRDFLARVRSRFPEHFLDKSVVDFGSLHVNGNNRWIFEGGSYVGVDIGAGPNVDIVSKAHEFVGDVGGYDVVCSTEMLEHDPHFAQSLNRMFTCLKSGGLMVLTMAGPGRHEHGTARSEPGSSPLTQSTWPDFYANRTPRDVMECFPLWDSLWDVYGFEVCSKVHDTRFFGVKR